MNIFFASNIVGDVLEFDEEEIRHLQVLRYSREDQIQVVDGKGNWYVAELVDLSKKRAVARVVERTTSPQRKPYHLHLAIAEHRARQVGRPVAGRPDLFVETRTTVEQTRGRFRIGAAESLKCGHHFELADLFEREVDIFAWRAVIADHANPFIGN